MRRNPVGRTGHASCINPTRPINSETRPAAWYLVSGGNSVPAMLSYGQDRERDCPRSFLKRRCQRNILQSDNHQGRRHFREFTDQFPGSPALGIQTSDWGGVPRCVPTDQTRSDRQRSLTNRTPVAYNNNVPGRNGKLRDQQDRPRRQRCHFQRFPVDRPSTAEFCVK